MEIKYNRANPKYKSGQVLISKKYKSFTIQLIEYKKGRWICKILENSIAPAWLSKADKGVFISYTNYTLSAGFEMSEMGTILYA